MEWYGIRGGGEAASKGLFARNGKCVVRNFYILWSDI